MKHNDDDDNKNNKSFENGGSTPSQYRFKSPIQIIINPDKSITPLEYAETLSASFIREVPPDMVVVSEIIIDYCINLYLSGNSNLQDLYCEELIDLIEALHVPFGLGNILKACMRYGNCLHSDEDRDLNKLEFFLKRERAKGRAENTPYSDIEFQSYFNIALWSVKLTRVTLAS